MNSKATELIERLCMGDKLSDGVRMFGHREIELLNDLGAKLTDENVRLLWRYRDRAARDAGESDL